MLIARTVSSSDKIYSMALMPLNLQMTITILILSILGKNYSRQHYDFFFIFPRNQDLTFHALSPLETVCVKC